MADSTRPARPTHVLTVESTERVGPHVVRVVLAGDSLADFTENGFTDSYVKLVFVDPTLGLEPPYDLRELRQTLPSEQQPIVRTYTVRWVDRATRRLAIDFVTHDASATDGVAAPWAARAVPGDRLVLTGPGGAYAPDPGATFHLLAGDLSALPAISAALAALPENAGGVALLEIGDPADELPLRTKAAVEIRWLVNPDPDDTGFLARAVAAIDWPEGVQAFVHGERESVKAVRAVLRERAVPREALSISAYWARGRTEDVFQAEKREPIGKID
ncbi:MAG: siderophore-interacting protein [Nocardioidaceae bacterium]